MPKASKALGGAQVEPAADITASSFPCQGFYRVPFWELQYKDLSSRTSTRGKPNVNTLAENQVHFTRLRLPSIIYISPGLPLRMTSTNLFALSVEHGNLEKDEKRLSRQTARR